MNAFFIGIGGMGMSGLAKILHSSGFKVAGSDRNLNGDYCKRLAKIGVKLYKQDGSGLEAFMKDEGLTNKDLKVVKSTAVEDHVPDVVSADELGVEQIMRSDLLASMFNKKTGIAIGGTAGKTTTTGIVTWILKYTGREPSCAVGGIITGLDTNAFMGKGNDFVIEADESDGSIVKYKSHVSIITNVSRDHKPMNELKSLFTSFLENTDEDGLRLVCGDDIGVMKVIEDAKCPVKTYGTTENCDYRAEDITIKTDHVSFVFDNTKYKVKLPGKHNVLNTLGAIVVARFRGVPETEIIAALNAFPGMKRRFETIGETQGVTIIDDFAHNPVEIQAAINTARKASKRRFIVYQPHGFGPLRFTRNDLVKVFSSLRKDEFLYIDDIYYGGGTVEKDVSSKDLTEQIKPNFADTFYFGNRAKIVEDICQKAISGDMVLVMGARDINQICSEILQKLPRTHQKCF